MDVTEADIANIMIKLESELKEISKTNKDNATLIQISADFKELKEVIQYFETSIDSIKTNNEDFKEIMKETVKNILDLKQKMLRGTITREELDLKLAKLTDTLKTKTLSKTTKIKTFIDKFISPKIVIFLVALILLILLVLFNPSKADHIIHDFTPIINHLVK